MSLRWIVSLWWIISLLVLTPLVLNPLVLLDPSCLDPSFDPSCQLVSFRVLLVFRPPPCGCCASNSDEIKLLTDRQPDKIPWDLSRRICWMWFKAKCSSLSPEDSWEVGRSCHMHSCHMHSCHMLQRRKDKLCNRPAIWGEIWHAVAQDWAGICALQQRPAPRQSADIVGLRIIQIRSYLHNVIYFDCWRV